MEALQEQCRRKRSALGTILEVDSPSSLPSSSHRKRRRVMPSLTSKNHRTEAVATNGSSPDDKATTLLQFNKDNSNRLGPLPKTTRAEQPGTSLMISITRDDKPEAPAVNRSVPPYQSRPPDATSVALHKLPATNTRRRDDSAGLSLVRLTKKNASSRNTKSWCSSQPMSSSRMSLQNARSHQRRRAKLVIEFNDYDDHA